MEFIHVAGVKPAYGTVELGRGADGIVIEVLDHPGLVIKDMNHPFKLGRNRVALELRLLRAVREAIELILQNQGRWEDVVARFRGEPYARDGATGTTRRPAVVGTPPSGQPEGR